MIAGRCVLAAVLVGGASLWLSPLVRSAEAWVLLSAALALLGMLVPITAEHQRRGAPARAALAGLAIWMPWVLPAGAQIQVLLLCGGALALASALAVTASRAAGLVLMALLALLALGGAGGAEGLADVLGAVKRAVPGQDPEPPRGPWRVAEVELTLTGPLERATASFPGYPPLDVRAELLSGEVASARAWIVAPREGPIATAAAPRWDSVEPAAGAASASAPLPAQAVPDWARRALPSMPAGHGRGRPLALPAVLVALATALLAAVLASRRLASRVATLAGLGVVAATGSWASVTLTDLRAGVRPASGAVIEGLASEDGETRWAMGKRHAGPYEESAPGLAEPSSGIILVPESPLGPASTYFELGSASARRGVVPRRAGDALDLIIPDLDLGLRVLRPEVNTFAAMGEVWHRAEGEGAWSGPFPWPMGAPMGASEADSGGELLPPLWLRSGLAAGDGLLVGQLEPGAALLRRLRQGPASVLLGDPVGGPEGAELWVRLVGFGL